MLNDSSPSSPASSEISVGSPTPPPVQVDETYFQPLKKMKLCGEKTHSSSQPHHSNNDVEKVTGFSIADILGHTEENLSKKESSSRITAKIVRPWDQLNEVTNLKNLLPTSFFHQEHRFSLDYHQQLQIHFRAQAQFLRQLNFDIVTSESGSDRSSSTTSDCCSPEIANRTTDVHQPKLLTAAKCTTASGTPLDALFRMTNKPFDESQRESGKYFESCVSLKHISIKTRFN